MARIAFLGDQLTAAGFRLAGVTVHTPDPDEEAALFRQLCARAEVVLITAESAARLPPADLHAARLRTAPLVLLVPDIRGRLPLPDSGAELRRHLGVLE
jgi:vacuolar-type H+-ATPase subunit F/Vma7